MKKLLRMGVLTLALLPAGCGDDGGEIGTGGGVGGVGGTIGGQATTAIVYVANSRSNNVSGYTISTTGGLVPVTGSPFGNVSEPSAVAVSSDAFFAYVANQNRNTVTAFRVGTDGRLILGPANGANPNPVRAGTKPVALAISADTKFLYVANSGSNDVSVFSIGREGVLTPVLQPGSSTNASSVVGAEPGSIGADPGSITITPNGRYLFVANRGTEDVTGFAIGEGGRLTRIPSAGGKTNPISTGGKSPKGVIASTNSSFLYVANSGSDTITAFQIDVNGLLTLVPSGASPNPVSVVGKSPNALILSENGRFLYSTTREGNIAVFTIGENGLLTPVSSSVGNSNQGSLGTPVAMTLSVDGRFLHTANRDDTNARGRVLAYRVDEETGALTPVNPLQPAGVPTGDEPSSIAAPGRPITQ